MPYVLSSIFKSSIRVARSKPSCISSFEALHRAQALQQQAQDLAMTVSSTDVVVVGSGLAGVVAALYSVDASPDLQCTLLEASPRLGGNSVKASSGINCLTTDKGDGTDQFVQDTLRSGQGLSDEAMVRVLVDDSNVALDWLQQQTRQNLSTVAQLGGHSVSRTHRNASGPNVGFALMKPLMDKVSEHTRIAVMTSAKLVALRKGTARGYSGWTVSIAKDEDSFEVAARAVVLAAGGFAGNAEAVLRNTSPAVAQLPTTNNDSPHAGSVLAIAQNVGAALKHLQEIQVHPTAFVDPADPSARSKILAPEALRGHGAILVNKQGKRFVNELARRDLVTDACQQAEQPIWMLLPQVGAEVFGMPAISFYAKRGLFRECEDLNAAATAMDIDGSTLNEEVVAYNECAAGQRHDTHGKSTFPAILEPDSKVYVASVTPALHYCMGGIEIDEHARVRGCDGQVVEGLFAAGECTGGVHGRNRLAGNSLLECAVFGRRAGQAAASHASPESKAG